MSEEQARKLLRCSAESNNDDLPLMQIFLAVDHRWSLFFQQRKSLTMVNQTKSTEVPRKDSYNIVHHSNLINLHPEIREGDIRQNVICKFFIVDFHGSIRRSGSWGVCLNITHVRTEILQVFVVKKCLKSLHEKRGTQSWIRSLLTWYLVTIYYKILTSISHTDYALLTQDVCTQNLSGSDIEVK